MESAVHDMIGSLRASAVEVLRMPSDVLRGTARISVFSSGYRKLVLHRRESAENAARLADKLTHDGSAGHAAEPYCRALRGAGARYALCSCSVLFAAVLFSPMLALICEEVFRFGGIYLYIPALVPLLFFAVCFASEVMRNGYIRIDRRDGCTATAHGAVCRRVMRFNDSAVCAWMSVRTPLMRNAAHMLCVCGAGMIPYAEKDGVAPRFFSSQPPVMSVGGENVRQTGGGCVLAAICSAVLATRLWLGGEVSGRMTGAALLPVLLLLYLRSRALSASSGGNALRLYRDSLEVRGVWGACVVTMRARRGEYAHLTVTQTTVQRHRGVCTLALRTPGCRRAVRCRGLDYRRTMALVNRAAGR